MTSLTAPLRPRSSPPVLALGCAFFVLVLPADGCYASNPTVSGALGVLLVRGMVAAFGALALVRAARHRRRVGAALLWLGSIAASVAHEAWNAAWAPNSIHDDAEPKARVAELFAVLMVHVIVITYATVEVATSPPARARTRLDSERACTAALLRYRAVITWAAAAGAPFVANALLRYVWLDVPAGYAMTIGFALGALPATAVVKVALERWIDRSRRARAALLSRIDGGLEPGASLVFDERAGRRVVSVVEALDDAVYRAHRRERERITLDDDEDSTAPASAPRRSRR